MRNLGLVFFGDAVAAVRWRARAFVERRLVAAKKKELLRAGALGRDEFLARVGITRGEPASALATLRATAPPPLLPDPTRAAALVTTRLPAARAAVLEDARQVKAHVFDLLGSGPVRVGDDKGIDWHLDWKVGVRWPALYYKEIPIKPSVATWSVAPERGRGEDRKMPWELSRFYHASALGRAFLMTRDEQWPRELRAQLEDWIAKNPFAHSCNWLNAMEVGLRAVGWLVGLELTRGSQAFEPAFVLEVLRQLYAHARFIVRNLEIAGTVTSNHYLADGVGLLLIAHALPPGKEVLHWRAQARALVEQEMTTQVRADGVDYENAVAYHRLVLELFLIAHLRLVRSGEPPSSGFRERLERMFDYVAAVTKPDGSTPHVGDADDGRAFLLGPLRPHDDFRYLLGIGAALFKRADWKRAAGDLPEALVWLLGDEGVRTWDALDAEKAPELGSRCFGPSRVVVLRQGGAHAYLEAGDVGIGGKGAHGHDDALSIELCLAGESVVRDAGPFVYSADPEKRFQARSIRSHNTVVVDGAEASGLVRKWLWMTPGEQPARLDGFEVGERGDWVLATHEGYRRLGIVHTRRLLLLRPEESFVVHDRLAGTGEHLFRWQVLVAFLDASVVPPVTAERDLLALARGRFPALDLPEATPATRFSVRGARSVFEVSLFATAPTEAKVELAVLSPSYGVEQEARRLVLEARSPAPFEVVATFSARAAG